MKQCKDYCPVRALTFNEQEMECEYYMRVNNIRLYDACSEYPEVAMCPNKKYVLIEVSSEDFKPDCCICGDNGRYIINNVLAVCECHIVDGIVAVNIMEDAFNIP